MKTAEQLQQEGAEQRKRGEFVPYVYPGQVARCVEQQIPHLVMGVIPANLPGVSPVPNTAKID